MNICLVQLKLGSMNLAKEYMNRVVTAVKLDAFSDDEEVMLQGVRFAYRVHQVTLSPGILLLLHAEVTNMRQIVLPVHRWI